MDESDAYYTCEEWASRNDGNEVSRNEGREISFLIQGRFRLLWVHKLYAENRFDNIS